MTGAIVSLPFQKQGYRFITWAIVSETFQKGGTTGAIVSPPFKMYPRKWTRIIVRIPENGHW